MYILIAVSDMYIKEAKYTKYEGSGIELQVVETSIVESEQMCAARCAGKTDCFDFTAVEDEAGVRCDFMTRGTASGTGTFMQDFFTISD